MTPERIAPLAHAALRIVAGFLFFQHGAQKLLGWFGGFGEAGTVGSWLSWPFGIAGIIEFFGGLLLLFGVKVRYVAVITAAEMAVALGWRHFPNGPWPIRNGGEPAVLFLIIFVFLWARGAGPFSVDERRTGGSAPPG